MVGDIVWGTLAGTVIGYRARRINVRTICRRSPDPALIVGAVQRGACRAIHLRQERARECHEIRSCRD